MTGLSAPTVALIAALLLAATILAAFGLVRAAERDGRRRAVRDARRLAALIEGFLDGYVGARTLRHAAARADAGAFWGGLEALPHRPAVARRRLAEALAGNPHARRERRALRDDSSWRRELAARRLGLVAEPASRRALRRALERGPELVTHAAAVALGRHRDAVALRWLLAHPGALARRTPRARVAVLKTYGRGALPLLAAALEAPGAPSGLERAMIETLGSGGHRPAATAIEQRLGSGDPEIKVAAARALGRIGATSAAPALIAALGDEAWPVRAVAAWALGCIGAAAPDAAPGIAPLAARLTDRAWWVRRHAAYALWEGGEAGRSALREIAAASPDPYARDMAREALGSGDGLDAA